MLIKNKYFYIMVFFAIMRIAYAEDKAKPRKEALPAIKGDSSIFVYDSKNKRDPFIALVSQDGRILEAPVRREKGGDIALEGIMYDPKGASYAVINTEIFKAGDSIGEYQILRIEPQKVIFLKAGAALEVELKKEEQ